MRVRSVPVSADAIGKCTATVVRGVDGHTVLVGAGTELSAGDIEAMMQRGVARVWVRDELFPEFEERSLVPETLREQAKGILRELFASLRESAGKPTSGQARALAACVRTLVDEIEANRDEVANIRPAQRWDDYALEHAVNVAATAILVGRDLGLSRTRLLRLGAGALLHDIGAAALPSRVLQKQGTLSPTEVEMVKQHPRRGWELVHTAFGNVMPSSAIVVLQHHERLDGSGYPAELRGDEIFIYSRIASAADVLDALRSERAHRRRFTPPETLRAMEEEAGSTLEAQVVKLLLRVVALVPEGSIVRLSNGQLAKVMVHNPGAPLQPVVTVVGSALDQPLPHRLQNLKHSGVRVEQICEEWPRALLERSRPRPLEGQHVAPLR